MSVPRFETVVDTDKSWFHLIEVEAELMGFDLMPWQVKAARLISALNADGSPRYDTVIITVPRQSGKSQLSKIVLSAAAKRNPNLALYVTAQTRMDAYHHLETLGQQLGASGQDVKTRLGIGNERIVWPNGSRLGLIAPTPGGAHGISIDFMLLDEVWALAPHVMAGVIPARSAKPDSQLLYISTMGTVESEVWNALVARGRESIELEETNIGYLEYSAETDEQVSDEETWHTFMPALGHTQTIETIRSARQSLTPSEFVRAFGNRVTQTLNLVFPTEWVKESWRIIQPPLRFAVGVDVNIEPPGASISTGHLSEDGSFAVRNVEWRYGSPSWVIDILKLMIEDRQVEVVSADLGGPTKVLEDQIVGLCDQQFVPLLNRSPRELAADTMSLFDAMREGKLALEKTEPLEAAFNGAHKRPIGDMWLVSRNRMLVDASPLISVVLAFGAAKELSVKPKIIPAIY